MNNDRIKRDNAVYNAWRLFVANGQIKSDVIGSALAVKWERYRLLGLRADGALQQLPQVDDVALATFYSDINKRVELECDKLQYSSIIVDENCIIQDAFIIDSNLAMLSAGSVLRESLTGNLSLYQSVVNKKSNVVFGAEHYLKHFQGYADITFPFATNKKNYYFVAFLPLKNYDERFLEKTAGDLNRWQMIWKLKSQNNRVELIECARVTVNRQGVILKSNNVLNFKTDDVIFDRLVGFNFEKLLAEGLFYSAENADGQRHIIVLLKQNQTNFELAIRQIKNTSSHNSSYDLFNSLSERSAQFKSLDEYVTAFSNRFKPILLMGDRRQVLSDGIKAFFNSGHYGKRCFIIDASLYNFKDDSTSLKWYREFSDCCIVLQHVECVDLKQQNEILQLIRDNDVSFRNNKLHILITALLSSDRDYFISNQIEEYCKDTTVKCFKTKHDNARQTDRFYQNNKLKSLSEIEANAIRDTLVVTGGNVSKSAKILKIGRTTLHRKIKQYQIETK